MSNNKQENNLCRLKRSTGSSTNCQLSPFGDVAQLLGTMNESNQNQQLGVKKKLVSVPQNPTVHPQVGLNLGWRLALW